MYICTLMPAPSDRELPMPRPVPVLDGQSPESHCLHCEKPLVPTDDPLLGVFARVLCPECRRVPGYRRLYRKRVGWTQGWELHLRILTQRAKAEERLFCPKIPIRNCCCLTNAAAREFEPKWFWKTPLL